MDDTERETYDVRITNLQEEISNLEGIIEEKNNEMQGMIEALTEIKATIKPYV